MLTIIIVSWNCRDEVVGCLESLAALRILSRDFETIVVDNASEDGTAAVLQSRATDLSGIRLRVICNSRNVGLSAATAQAYAKASGEWLLLVNPDIRFNEDTSKLLAYGMNHSNEIVTVEMVNPDGALQRVIHRRFPTIARVFFDFGFVGSYLDEKLMHHLVRRNYAYQDDIFPSVARIEQPGASFLLLNQQIVNKLGFIFDRRFPVWWNDVDLSKRAQAAGVPRTLLSDIKVKHGLGRSGSRKMPSSVQWHLFCRSMTLYARIWKMHPHLLQLLFSLDAIASVPLAVVVQARVRGIRLPLTKAVSHAAAQIGGLLGA